MDRVDLLREAMAQSNTTQSELARMSGVRQPSISQFLSRRITMSDDQLDRLLQCLGRRLVVERHVVVADLTRSERRSWLLHRRLAARLTADNFSGWTTTMASNLAADRGRVRGEPHVSNLRRWAEIATHGDVSQLRAILTGLDRQSIEMREVSPMSGLLDDADRRRALGLDH